MYAYEADFLAKGFLTVGGALSSLTLMLTFLQFTKPEHVFRVEVRGFHRTWGLILLATTFVGGVASALLTLFRPQHPLFLISYPAFWELSGALLGAIGLTMLGYAHLYPVRFHWHNAQGFANAVHRVLSGNNKEARDQLALELGGHENIRRIALAILDAKAEDGAATQKFADAILQDIGCDWDFCTLLVEQHGPLVEELLAILVTASHPSSGARAIVQTVAGAALASDESILQKDFARYDTGVDDALGYPADCLMVRLFGSFSLHELYMPLAGWKPKEPRFHSSGALARFWPAFSYAVKSWREEVTRLPDEHETRPPGAPRLDVPFPLCLDNIHETLEALLERQRAHRLIGGKDDASLDSAIDAVQKWFWLLGSTVADNATLLRCAQPLQSLGAYRASDEPVSFAGASARLLAAVVQTRRLAPLPLYYPTAMWRYASKTEHRHEIGPILDRSRALIMTSLAKDFRRFTQKESITRAKNLKAIAGFPQAGLDLLAEEKLRAVPRPTRALCSIEGPWKLANVSSGHPVGDDLHRLLRQFFAMLYEIDKELAMSMVPDTVQFDRTTLTLFVVTTSGEPAIEPSSTKVDAPQSAPNLIVAGTWPSAALETELQRVLDAYRELKTPFAVKT